MITVDLLSGKITHHLNCVTWGRGQRKSHDHVFNFAHFALHWGLHHSVIPSPAHQKGQAGLWRAGAGGQESGTCHQFTQVRAEYIAWQDQYAGRRMVGAYWAQNNRPLSAF